MPAAIKTAISSFRLSIQEPNASLTHFLDEDLGSVPAPSIPEDFRKLSRFLPVIVLVPKSVAYSKATQKKPGSNKSDTCPADTSEICLPLDTAKFCLRNPKAEDTFEFGGITGCFSTMEIHRNGRPVTLTCKEFKTLKYFVKNPRRVISRDELLNEVWGYENYPCTRTVDNHILRLRQKLETEPAHPKHFHTVHGAGYKFIPQIRHQFLHKEKTREMAASKPTVLLAIAFLACSLPIGRAQSPKGIEIIAKRFTYDPDTITLKRGEPIVLVLHSIDVTHGIKIEAFNIKSDDIKKDKETEVRFTPQETGHFEGQCSRFCGKGHGSMKLQIDVVP